MIKKKLTQADLKEIYHTISFRDKPLLKVKTQYGEKHVAFIEQANDEYKLRCNFHLSEELEGNTEPRYIVIDDVDEYEILGG